MIEEHIKWDTEITDLLNIDPIILQKFPMYQYNKRTPTNFCDYAGMQFGRLKVLYRGENYPGWHVSWICQCNCDDHTILRVKADNLRSGNTNSCGCYNIDRIKETCKKYNRYDLSGEYGIGYCYSSDKKFYFDLEDYDKIKNYCWHCSKRGYIESRIDGKLVKMHRLIMGVDDPKIKVDHKFHDENGMPRTYDNRKINLRLCTQQENMWNSKLRSNNTSGETGVSWEKETGMWRARIFINGKGIHLGRFTDFDEAVKVRKKAEEKYFGEYSYDNSMKEGVV